MILRGAWYRRYYPQYLHYFHLELRAQNMKARDILMLIEISIGAAVSTAVGIRLKNYRRLRQSRRREQLLIQGLHQTSIDRPVLTRRLVSTRQSEMESLLLHVRARGEVLVAALAAEAQLGGTLCAEPTKDESLFEQWKVTRSVAEQAEEAYEQAVEQYREFVQSLPPPMRASAAERGVTAMSIAHA